MYIDKYRKNKAGIKVLLYLKVSNKNSCVKK